MATNKDVISLSAYRHAQKRLYMEKNERRLDQFLQSFVSRHFNVSYAIIADQYLAFRYNQNEMAWDYQDFRETLIDAIAEVFGDQLWTEIRRLFWFDPKWLSRDELIERCIRHYVLGETLVAAQ